MPAVALSGRRQLACILRGGAAAEGRGERETVALISFYSVCSVANVGIADFLFVQGYDWCDSGIRGIVVSAVWNYATSALFTWRK